VTEDSLRFLTSESKDLVIAGYLVQGAFRTYGLAGLAKAFSVARTLVEYFWDTLYPLPNEEGLFDRLAQMNALAGAETMIEPLKRLHITRPRGNDPYIFSQYVDAAAGRKSPSMADVVQAAAETDTAYYTTMFADLTRCIEEFDALDRQLQEKSGVDEARRPRGPSLGKLRQTLVDIHAAVQHLAKDRLPTATEESETPRDNAEAPVDHEVHDKRGRGGGTLVAGRLESREEALRMLEKVAEFFVRQDPHSLLGAQVRKIVYLANLKPEEYYSELLEDESARRTLFKLVGIKPPS
jgi:type VI secretion system protein ImpA